MCGLAGFTSHNPDKIKSALELIQKRGPDGQGIFCDKEISLGHRRLSIIDLTDNASQPLEGKDGNIVIVFNGEIYNFQELKESFPKSVRESFQSKSDTEVILYGYSLYGVEFFSKMRGMWAFAIYDKRAKKIILSRDSFGIKPLYYAVEDNVLYFGSEMKVMKYFLDAKEPNKEYYFQFFNLGYFIPPQTCYKNIKKVLPGEILAWDMGKKDLRKGEIKICDEENAKSGLVKNMEEAVNLIEKSLLNSVHAHFISDAPVGLLLSGGNDSSLIASLAAAIGKKPVAYNLDIAGSPDAKYAEKVSEFLGLELRKMAMTAKVLEEQYENIWEFIDEPIADSSIIPTSLIYSSIKGKSKVVLSGEGGDEMCGGYARHILLSRLTKIFEDNKIIDLLNKFSGYSKFSVKYSNPILNRVRNYLLSHKFNDLIGSYLSCVKIIDLPVFYREIRKELFGYYDNSILQNEPVNLFFDRWLYLPNDLMYKTDMASMAYSIEARVPFLDKDLFRALKKIHPDFCLSPGYQQKFLLRKIMEKYLPKELIYRSKKGFSFSFGKYDVKPFESELRKALVFHQRQADSFGLSSSPLVRLLSEKNSEMLKNKFQAFSFALVSNWKIFGKA